MAYLHNSRMGWRCDNTCAAVFGGGGFESRMRHRITKRDVFPGFCRTPDKCRDSRSASSKILPLSSKSFHIISDSSCQLKHCGFSTVT